MLFSRFLLHLPHVPPDSKRKVLNPRQRKYIRERVTKGLSKRQAALNAGYSPDTAENAGVAIESSQDVQAEFQRLIRQSIPQAKIAETLREGLGATKTEYFAVDGKVTDERTTPNYSERRQYASLIAEYAGYVLNEDTNRAGIGGVAVQVNVAVGSTAPESGESPDRPPEV